MVKLVPSLLTLHIVMSVILVSNAGQLSRQSSSSFYNKPTCLVIVVNNKVFISFKVTHCLTKTLVNLNLNTILARAVGIPVGQRLGGQLVTTLVVTKNVLPRSTSTQLKSIQLKLRLRGSIFPLNPATH